MLRKYLPAIGSLLLLLQSCITPRYINNPSPANIPYFEGKGDAKVTAYYSAGLGGSSDLTFSDSKNHGVDLQGAYAVADHWALTASYYSRMEQDHYLPGNVNYFDSSVVTYHRHMTDFGGGIFLPTGPAKTFYVSLYTGIGLGEYSFKDVGRDKQNATYSRFHDAKITKFYIQPVFSTIAGKAFHLSFTPRFTFLHYGNIGTNYTADEEQYYWLDKIRGKTISFFEPTANMQIGIPGCDWLKVDGSFTFLSDPFSAIALIESRSFIGSVGLSFDFLKPRRK